MAFNSTPSYGESVAERDDEALERLYAAKKGKIMKKKIEKPGAGVEGTFMYSDYHDKCEVHFHCPYQYQYEWFASKYKTTNPEDEYIDPGSQTVLFPVKNVDEILKELIEVDGMSIVEGERNFEKIGKSGKYDESARKLVHELMSKYVKNKKQIQNQDNGMEM